MSTLTTATIIPFTGSRRETRICVVSPAVFYPIEGLELIESHNRGELMHELYGALKFDLDIEYSKGVARIKEMRKEFVSDAQYWGGDGILMTLESADTIQDFSLALSEMCVKPQWVVYDPAEKKYYSNGEEIFYNTPNCVPVEPAP